MRAARSATSAASSTARRSRCRSGCARGCRRGAARRCCCCSSTRRSTRSAAARARRPADGRGAGARRASTSSDPRGGKLTYHGPGQLVGYPIMRVADVVAYLRTMERAIVAALAEEGVAARGAPRGPEYTGVWVEDRKIASIGVHLSQGRHRARLRGQRRQRPAAVPPGRGLRAAGRADDVDRPGDRPRRTGWRASASGWPRLRAGARAAAADVRPRGDRSRRRYPPWREHHAQRRPRLHVTRSRANPGGMDVTKVLGTDTEPFRGRKPPWFKVPPPGGREVPRADRADPRRRACTRSARRPPARTSASAGSAAPRRS